MVNCLQSDDPRRPGNNLCAIEHRGQLRRRVPLRGIGKIAGFLSASSYSGFGNEQTACA
jgi:hypothetical protein